MQPAPLAIRVAGALVAVQGLLGIVFGVALIFRVAQGAGGPGNNVLGEVAYFLLLGLGVAFVGVLLVLGRRGARTPAGVVQLVLLGVAWYVASGSEQLAPGIALGLVALAILVLLFTSQSRQWSMGTGEYERGDDDRNAGDRKQSDGDSTGDAKR